MIQFASFMPPIPSRLAEAGLVYCAVVWGSTFYLVKDALSGVDASALVAWRFLLSAALLAPLAWRRRRKVQHLAESAVLALLLAALYLSQTIGLAHTSAANSGFITGLFVVFVPLFLLVLFGTPPTRVQWAASLLALAGLWLLTGGVAQVNRGDLLTVVSAMAYAGHLLATDRYVRADADTVLLSFHQFWMTGALSLAACGLGRRPVAVHGTNAAGIILFLAAIPTLSAFFIQMSAQRFTSPLRVALIFSLEPVFAALFAWTRGGEAFSPARASGGLLIVAAMIGGELSKLPTAAAARKEVLPV
jgi:drug/metabolite transporter (DMT)-like permease